MTIQEAAGFLQISRVHLIKLLDQGEIPFHKVGANRRIATGDVIEYRNRRFEDRSRGMVVLTQLSQDLGQYE